MQQHFHGLGIIVLILDIWAWWSIIQSTKNFFTKLLWCLLVFFLPLLGFVIWFFAGPRKVKV